MRTVLYARYSSQLQNSRSIEDQVAVLRERATREGWEIVDVFTDYAISGAAGIDEGQRPGLNAMLDRVEATSHPGGRVDQVFAESTDRIARHQGDAFTIRERIIYAGARLFTMSDGEITDYTAAFKGLMDSQFRKELGAKIKRGQRGAVASGRAPAGLAYGYRKANKLNANGDLVRGLREIDPDQAEIVRRMFVDYAADISPRLIAKRLNDQGVSSPGGGKWRASTIAGERVRQNGILQNRLYAGVLVHNRTSKVIEPKTRKVRIRPNPEADWITQPMPALRIVDDALWNAVQRRRSRHDGIRPERARRPKHMLSGLATCGVCGGGWTVRGGAYWGCGRYADGRGCSNNRTVKSEAMERRVLSGLQDKMLDPELVSVFVAEYHREYARRTADLTRERARLERRHDEAVGKVNRLVEAIANGADEFVEVRAILTTARATRDGIKAELAELDALPVVALHPAVATDYRRQVTALNDAMSENPESRTEALPILRGLIDQVTVIPALVGRGVDISVEGKLAAILALATGAPVHAAHELRQHGSGRRESNPRHLLGKQELYH